MLTEAGDAGNSHLHIRFDGAVYFKINDRLSAQVMVENIFNTRYIATADGNNNITPGSPRVFRFSITPRF